MGEMCLSITWYNCVCEKDVYLSSYHQSPHPLLLNAFVLFLLLTLRVSVVCSHSFGQLLHLSSDGAMVLLKVFGMLEDAVQIFLKENE